MSGLRSLSMQLSSVNTQLAAMPGHAKRAADAAPQATQTLREMSTAADDARRSLDSALENLKQAAAPHGTTAASEGFAGSGGSKSGGFLTPAYALHLVEQYAKAVEFLNSKSREAVTHAGKIRIGLNELEMFFKKFFPQFGRLDLLAKELLDSMRGVGDEADRIAPPPPTQKSSGGARIGGLRRSAPPAPPSSRVGSTTKEPTAPPPPPPTKSNGGLP